MKVEPILDLFAGPLLAKMAETFDGPVAAPTIDIEALRARNVKRVRDGLKPLPIPGEPEGSVAAPPPQAWPSMADARRDLRAYHELMFGPGGIEPPAAPNGELGDVFDLALARGTMRPVHVDAYRKLHIGRTFGMSFFSFAIATCPRCGAVPESVGVLRGSTSWAHLCTIDNASSGVESST